MTTRTQARLLLLLLLLLLRAWSIFPPQKRGREIFEQWKRSFKRGKINAKRLSLSLSLSLCVCVCVYIYICIYIYIYVCVCVCECSLFLFDACSFQKCNEQNFSRYFQVCHTQKMFYFYFDAVYIYMCVLLQLHDRSDRREPFYLRVQLFVQLVVFFVFIFDHL